MLLEISQNREALGFRPATLLKVRPWQKCLLLNFAKFLRTPFFTEHLWWLLLNLSGNTLTWNISLILTPYNSHKKVSFKIHKLTKNLFRLNIFAIYFPPKLIVFIVHIFTIRAFSLYQTKVIFAFMKKTDVAFMKKTDVYHFYRKCIIEHWLIG